MKPWHVLAGFAGVAAAVLVLAGITAWLLWSSHAAYGG